jgi:hypothetical protein
MICNLDYPQIFKHFNLNLVPSIIAFMVISQRFIYNPFETLPIALFHSFEYRLQVMTSLIKALKKATECFAG